MKRFWEEIGDMKITISEKDTYIKLLQVHDWYYDYSDDSGVWNKGYAERKAMNRLQEKHDPDNKIWNEYAPQMWQR
jgi:hypothetical protein|tara:strand:+ start:548 stop:775 length:228 start_codon:yes stop_codon:yes gene_type:complete